MQESLAELQTRVADRTIDWEQTVAWEEAVVTKGLLATGDSKYIEEAKRIVDRGIETQSSEGQLYYGDVDPKTWLNKSYQKNITGVNPFPPQVEGAGVGQSVLDFYERTGEKKYLEAAHRQYEFLESAARTEDGGILHFRPRAKPEKELYIDAIMYLVPFLSRYGAATGKTEAFDEAVNQIQIHTKHLQDPHTGLFRHIWREKPNTFPSSEFTSRPNGWLMIGVIETLEDLPSDHSGRESILEILREQAASVKEFQDRSGFWHNVIDDNETPMEASGTLNFAYAFKRAYDNGFLDDDSYEDAAMRALNVAKGVVSDEGEVRRVSDIPGTGGSPLTSTRYGQGSFLLAASAFL
jgi:unsaturated rhamnogalacturonyl hydrolase